MKGIGRVAALVVLLAAGCTSNGGGGDGPFRAADDREWKPPARYTFDVNAGCGLRSGLVGAHRITVVNDEPVAIEPLQGSHPVPLADALTIPGIVRRGHAALRDGADSVRFARSEAGIPTRVKIDRIESAIDDEECYQISHLVTETPLSGPGVAEPPPVTVRNGNRSLVLRPYTWCYRNGCADGIIPRHPPRVHGGARLLLDFALTNWTVRATFTPRGLQKPRQMVIPTPTEAGLLLRPPSRFRAKAHVYDVTISARGPGGGDLYTMFRWVRPS